jgi:hypothetical protein|tara:strand:+ start:1770 stop:2027 length:258 start_codon:yes stop_codon:yes gene_type:complete
MPNPFGKTRAQEKPYAIYKQGPFEYRVLKTYKMPKSEAKDIYARWFLATKGPHSMGFELGDGYAKDIRDNSELILADTDWLDHYT